MHFKKKSIIQINAKYTKLFILNVKIINALIKIKYIILGSFTSRKGTSTVGARRIKKTTQ